MIAAAARLPTVAGDAARVKAGDSLGVFFFNPASSLSSSHGRSNLTPTVVSKYNLVPCGSLGGSSTQKNASLSMRLVFP